MRLKKQRRSGIGPFKGIQVKKKKRKKDVILNVSNNSNLSFTTIEIKVCLGWLVQSKGLMSLPPREKGQQNLSFYSQNHLLCLLLVSRPARTHRPQVVDRLLSPSLPPSLSLCLPAQFAFNKRQGDDTTSITGEVLFYGPLWDYHTCTQCECELMNSEQCKFLYMGIYNRLLLYTGVHRQTLMEITLLLP